MIPSKLMRVNPGEATSPGFQLANLAYTGVRPKRTQNIAYTGISIDSDTTDFTFSPDGTRMYTSSSVTDVISQYSLSTAWDITTLSFVASTSISGRETASQGIDISSDGTKIYIIGSANDTIYQLPLSTAWDITTLSLTADASIAVGDTVPTSVRIRPDGLAIYITGDGSNIVKSWTLSTAWSLSGATAGPTFSLTGYETNPTGLTFSSDGTKMYVCGVSGDDVTAFSLSTPWNVSTATLESVYFPAGEVSTGLTSAYLGNSDKSFYLSFYTPADVIEEYYLPTANDLSSCVDTSENRPQTTVAAYQFHFSPDGTKLFYVSISGDVVVSGTLSTAYDISTFSQTGSSTVTSQQSLPYGCFIASNGIDFYVVGNTEDTVAQYTCNTAWDASSITFVRTLDVSAYSTSCRNIWFKEDGSKMYIVDGSSNVVYQWNLGTAWNISTASYSSSYASPQSNPGCLSFSSGGDIMYLAGTTNFPWILQANLSTPWDVSTASYAYIVWAGQNPDIRGLNFTPDGHIMYTSDDSNGFCKYTL